MDDKVIEIKSKFWRGSRLLLAYQARTLTSRMDNQDSEVKHEVLVCSMLFEIE